MSNDNDKTSIMFTGGIKKTANINSISQLKIAVHLVNMVSPKIYLLNKNFTIGRSRNNTVIILDLAISRKHLTLTQKATDWYIEDNNSSNGTYLNGKKVSQMKPLSLPCKIQFGSTATFLNFSLASEKIQTSQLNHQINNQTQIMYSPETDIFQTEATSQNTPPITSNRPYLRKTHSTQSEIDNNKNADPDIIEERIFGKKEPEDMSDQTILLRKAVHTDRKKKSKKYKIVLGFMLLFLMTAIVLIVYQQNSIDKARTLAIDMFYDMKVLEIDLAKAEIQLQQENTTILKNKIDKEREKLRNMRQKYLAYLKELDSFKFNINKIKKKVITKFSRPTSASQFSEYEEKLILRVAQKFGESELEITDGFKQEVHVYINKWQRSNRMNRAIQRLQQNGYTQIIISAMQKYHLPPQFLYLALQESNFNTLAIGLQTHYGIAKGAWQFLPGTAKDFGLTLGPLANVRQHDPADERFDFKKASYAGARYLKHIYSTESQASGLLVMVGYNYGHNRVRAKIRKMPNNPRERNFWKFTQRYKIPDETHGYVYYIFAAAVIGEDPKYFGFKFQSPTANIK